MKATWMTRAVLVVTLLIAAGCDAGASVALPSPDPATLACGEEVATRQDGPWNEAGRACFWSAYEEGRLADFRSTRLTIEGAPVTYHYRIVGGGRVQVLIDSRRDTFSNRGWTLLDCPRLVRDDVGPIIGFGPGDDCIALPFPSGLT